MPTVHHTHENVGWFYYLHTQYLYPICQTAYTGSAYSIVLVTLKRHIAVCWPLELNRVLTRRVVIGAIVAVGLLSAVANIPRWLELLPLHPVTWLDEETVELYVEYEQLHHNTAYVLYYHGVFWITLMYGIPFVLLAVFNFLVWKKVRDTNVKRAHLSRTSNAEISVTKMLLTVSGAFIGCNAVNCTLVIIFVVLTGEHHAYNIGIFVAIPLIINSSVNIIIYCAKGKIFRKQFVVLLWPVLCNCCTRGAQAQPMAGALGKVTLSNTQSNTSGSSTTTRSTVSNFGSTKKLDHDKPSSLPLG